MNSTMECPSCGAKFYSSGWREMLESGERCACGAVLRELASPQPPASGKPMALAAPPR